MSLIDQYSPTLRYFSPARRALVVIAKEGVVLSRRIDDDDCRRKKAHLSYEEWLTLSRGGGGKATAAGRADAFSPRHRGRKQSFFPILRMPAIAQVDNARCLHFRELACK